jgi:signal transduction histidine kinase
LGPADENDPFLVEVTELPDGGKLVVGADTHPREELLEWIVAAFSWAGGAAILVALAGGLVLGLSMSRRVEAMNDAAVRIIGGDLGERLAVRGTGDEFDRLAIQLNRMLDRIQALMEGLRQVSNDIAHDLRTPLSRLRQHLERTHDRSATLDEYQDAVERAIGETDAILATFAALLRIAQIEAGGRRQGFATVDLSELAQRIGEAYGPVAEEQGRLLHSWIDPGVIVRGDGELLTQLLSNLIENVLCHTPAGTPVELKVHPRGNQAVMAVADRGPGVPAGDRARILKRFVRLDGSRSTPGSGLGLSLVAAVAELHGARLRLEDHQPGLCVELEFPQHGTKQA